MSARTYGAIFFGRRNLWHARIEVSGAYVLIQTPNILPDKLENLEKGRKCVYFPVENRKLGSTSLICPNPARLCLKIRKSQVTSGRINHKSQIMTIKKCSIR